jgi:multicomponent Na+:H+ antiporter subunit E
VSTKIFTLLGFVTLLFGLLGFPKGLVELLFILSISIISYLFATKFDLIPSKFYLNYRHIAYFIWLIREIFISSLGVIRIICRKNMNLTPVFEWIDSNQKNDTSLVIYANSITLTPGTVTLDILNNMLLVHALDQSLIDSLKYENITMGERLKRISEK